MYVSVSFTPTLLYAREMPSPCCSFEDFLIARLRMVRKALVDKFLCGSSREEVVGRFSLRYRVSTVDTVDEEQKGKPVGS